MDDDAELRELMSARDPVSARLEADIAVPLHAGEIRARRMAQLQASGGGGGGGGGSSRGGPPMGGPGGAGGGGPGGGEGQSREEQEAKQRAEDEQMRTIMASVLEPEARERCTSLAPLSFSSSPPVLTGCCNFTSEPHLDDPAGRRQADPADSPAHGPAGSAPRPRVGRPARRPPRAGTFPRSSAGLSSRLTSTDLVLVVSRSPGSGC